MYRSNAWRRGRTTDSEPERIRILSVQELLDRIAVECPNPLRENEKKITIGFVGYPNVGKSSTINALVGEKKVTVSSTPGKTKHFQTIHLDETTVLCDCPGLVFPSFATTKAEMVINGVLPIDQLREHTGPAQLVAQRIPRHALQTIYGIIIKTLDAERNVNLSLPVKGDDLCQAFAIARGFRKAAQGNPDEARASRFILKDYVNVSGSNFILNVGFFSYQMSLNYVVTTLKHISCISGFT
jgi:large subunit GTPase 1